MEPDEDVIDASGGRRARAGDRVAVRARCRARRDEEHESILDAGSDATIEREAAP